VVLQCWLCCCALAAAQEGLQAHGSTAAQREQVAVVVVVHLTCAWVNWTGSAEGV
jgi:hypothetical protein